MSVDLDILENLDIGGIGRDPAQGIPIDILDGGTSDPGGNDVIIEDPSVPDLGGGGGGVVIGQGEPPTIFDYSIEQQYSAAGNAYLASGSSNITCNSSVAVLSRFAAFSATNTSSAVFSNCCSYASNQGFMSTNNSRILASASVSAISGHNFWVSYSSSMSLNRCASVFPVKSGVSVRSSSSFNSSNFDTMTLVWSNDPVAGVPIHFSSRENSFCANNTINLSSRSLQSGLSGSLLNTNPISFIWSQISGGGGGLTPYSPLVPTVGTLNLFEDASASYRFVPRSHSSDWNYLLSNGNEQIFPSTSPGTSTLTMLLTQHRSCYASVKPPLWMYPPEDFSGATAFVGAISSYLTFNLSNVLNSLI
jgi:hypothetical protein